MLSDRNEQARIRQYLLGQLGGDDREQFEQRLLTQDQMFVELLAIEDELVDEYVTGTLHSDEIEMFEKYFLSSPERRQKVRFAKAFRKYAAAHPPLDDQRDSPTTSLRSSWRQLFTASPLRVVAVAAVVLLAAVGVWRVFLYQSEVDKGLIALNNAYKQQRPIEARVSKLDYAPFLITRGGESDRVNSLEQERAERYLLDAVHDHPNAASYHALGEFYLTKKDFDKAILQFEEALRGDASNARLQSDLGAALLEKGKADRLSDDSGKGFAELAKSLEHLNKALELNGSLLEALFNRALVHQELVLPEQAREDWQKYLERDSNSAWADEARQKLILIEEQRKKTSRTREELLRDFLSAYESRDDERAWLVISRSREALSRKLIWEQLLDEILSAPEQAVKGDAESKLQALAYEGDLEYRTAGDAFVSGLAQFYRSSSEYHWRLLAEARALMKQGHEYYFQHKLDNAVEVYAKARQIFSDLSDKWESQYAEHWIGYCYYEQGKTQESVSALEALARSLQKENYQWLLMRTLHLISSCYHNLNDYSKAIDYNRQALSIAERIDDLIGIFNVASILTFQYSSMGNHQQAFANAQRSLSVMPDCPLNEIQFARHYTIIALACDAAAFYNAAIDYQKEGLRRALAMGHVQHTSLDYARLGLMYAKLGDYGEAHRNLDLAYTVAESVSDETPRKEMMAFSALQSGHLYRAQGDFSKAINSYDQSIALADHFHFKYDVYEAHKNRLFCYLAVGDDRSTAEELNTTLDLAERYRSTIVEADNRNDFFDIQQSVYDLATDFAYSRLNEPQQAFAYSEKSRSRSLLDSVLRHADSSGEKEWPAMSFASIAEPLELTEIQRRLPEEAEILEYAVLNDSVLIWVISKNQFSTVEKKINQNDLEKKVEAYTRLVSVANDGGEEVKSRARELFDDLIKPAEPLLQRAKTVYLIPDKFLNTLPFSTLIGETGRFLFEDYRLEISPSSTLLVVLSEIARRKDGPQDESLLSVGNPRFDRNEFPSLSDLPSAAREAEEVAHSYDSARVLRGANATRQRVTSQMPSADVIHFALHSVVNEQSPLHSRLVFAKDSTLANPPPFEGSLQASEIYELNLPRTRLAVLSACQTGAERYYGGEQMISLARPFLAIGVPLVLVSLWPVDSDVTAELMICFHKHRKQDNISSAEALRRAQLDMLRRPEERFHSAFCWGAFVLIGGSTKF